MRESVNIGGFNESPYHDTYTRLMYVFITGLFVASHVNGEFVSDSQWFWVLVTLPLVYTLLPLVFKHLAFLTNRSIILLLNYALYFFLIVFFVPVGHPLVLSGFVVVATGAYWRGLDGFLWSFGAVSLTLSTSYLYQDAPNLITFSDIIYTPLVMAVLGGLVVRFTTQDQAHREQLIKTSKEANFERRRLLSLINSMADAVIAIDKKGVIQLYNGAALSLLNTNDTLSNKKLDNYLILQTKSGTKKHLLDLVGKTPKIIKKDTLLFTNNLDETINLYIDLAPVRISGTDQKEDGYIVLLRDITQEKTIEEQRDEFISIVSHELRTPIAITEANISTAMHPGIKSTKKRLELFEQAHKNIVFLASLVNDITLLAHAEQGGLDTTLTKTDAKEVANELLRNYRSQASEKKLKLELKVDGKIPAISTNVERLNEVLQDFITNAIKYTQKGSVTIELSQPDKQHVRFGIRDTGIGISTTEQNKVFDKFYRSEDYRTREHSGTGLGLYIATKLAKLIRAKLGVESKIDEGSLFFVDVPVYKKK